MPAQHAYKLFAITRLRFHNTLKAEHYSVEELVRMRESIIKYTNVIVEIKRIKRIRFNELDHEFDPTLRHLGSLTYKSIKKNSTRKKPKASLYI